MSIRYFDLEELLETCSRYGIGPVRDVGLLESAAHRPRTEVFGLEAYPDLATKAAVLLESIVRNHPLVDGNKRLGWLAAAMSCHVNGQPIEAPDDDAYDLVIGVAEGRIGYEESADTLAGWF